MSGPRGVAEHSLDTTVAELTRVVASSLDYTGALGELTRIAATRLGWCCIVELIGTEAPVRLAHEPSIARLRALAPLDALLARMRVNPFDVSAVSGSRRALELEGDEALAEHARQALDVAWLASTSITSSGGDMLGTLTIMGWSDDAPRAPEIAADLALVAASSIENGRKYAAAMRALRAREQILGLVAHELKNPLSVILLGATRALEAPTSESCAMCGTHRELQIIQRSASRMKRLVGDLLDLASIDAGSFAMSPSGCDVAAVARAAMHDSATGAAAAGVELVEDFTSNLPSSPVDADRLTQVLLNLISNAVKFTPRGGRVRVRTTLVDDVEVVLAVEDSGRGIPPNDLERIFDRFWQAPESARFGTGLGLAICKSIVELAGGRIWAQSTEGVGTTIHVALPLVPLAVVPVPASRDRARRG